MFQACSKANGHFGSVKLDPDPSQGPPAGETDSATFTLGFWHASTHRHATGCKQHMHLHQCRRGRAGQLTQIYVLYIAANFGTAGPGQPRACTETIKSYCCTF
jgi:hypothetical protein